MISLLSHAMRNILIFPIILFITSSQNSPEIISRPFLQAPPLKNNKTKIKKTNVKSCYLPATSRGSASPELITDEQSLVFCWPFVVLVDNGDQRLIRGLSLAQAATPPTCWTWRRRRRARPCPSSARRSATTWACSSTTAGMRCRSSGS